MDKIIEPFLNAEGVKKSKKIRLGRFTVRVETAHLNLYCFVLFTFSILRSLSLQACLNEGVEATGQEIRPLQVILDQEDYLLLNGLLCCGVRGSVSPYVRAYKRA